MSPRIPKDDNQDDSVRGSDSWGEWANYVFAELKRFNTTLDKERDDFQKLSLEVARLQIKSSLWGAGAGAISVIIMMGVTYLSSMKDHNVTAPQQTTHQQYTIPPGFYLTPIPSGSNAPPSPAAAQPTPQTTPPATKSNP